MILTAAVAMHMQVLHFTRYSNTVSQDMNTLDTLLLAFTNPHTVTHTFTV